MVKTINAKKGAASEVTTILYIIVIAVVIVAVIVFFWMSQTGALDKMAAQISSLLSFNLLNSP